jgi:transposase
VHGLGQRLSPGGAEALPNARIVADRFHVIRIIHHHFLACRKELDAAGSKRTAYCCR